jgi:probable rRNA maturation factor
VNVFFGDEQEEPVDGAGLLRFAEIVLEEEGFGPDTEMAVILIGPEQIAHYNERFMGRQGPTDVLAFPLEDLVPGHAPVPIANDPPVSLGDVFLCPTEIRARAAANGIPFEDFMYLLVVHGILHLLGYDHGDEASAERMERREEDLLARIGRTL